MGYASKVRQTSTVADEPVTPTVRKITDWSTQQDAIFNWFKTSKVGKMIVKNLVVVARAGTGKTTTIVEGVTRAPESEILVAAFNKRIAVELEKRVQSPAVSVKTLHGIGFAIVREFWPRVRVAQRTDDRARQLSQAVCGGIPDTILKLVSKLHTKGREITPTGGYDELAQLAERFEIIPDFFWFAQGYTLDYVVSKALAAMEFAKKEDCPKGGIDFADMIFLPLAKGWAVPRYSLVVVDEAQDMTVSQLDLARRVLAADGRFCVVGDDKQAIYGFRGADSNSLSRLRKELDAGELGLTTTYRCGKKIVEMAQFYAPDFTAGSTNSEGVIDQIDREKLCDAVGYGDFVLSRLNAPLAGYVMKLMRSGKRARIAGRDIGQTLKTIVRKHARGAQSMEDFFANVEKWAEGQRKRFLALKWDSKLHEMEDTVETLMHIGEGCDTMAQMEDLCDTLFTDDGLGDKGMVTLSSVHKAKGLEADRVFVLDFTLRRGRSQEEDNIVYVAITRARHTLTMVL